MKIIFTFGGLPHYYNYILNRLNRLPDSTVKVIIPESRGKTLGKGVHESLENIEFGVIRLPEKKSWYGKLYFHDFKKTIEDEKPDIIVTIWPYILGFLLIPSWRRVRKKVKFKLIYKDIPFNIPRYENAFQYYRNQINTENNKAIHRHWGLKQMVYFSLLRKLFRNFLTSVDAHVYYTEEAFDIIPSYGVDKNKIFITYNSPDTDRLFKYRAEIEHNSKQALNQPNIILHMGRLVAWKKVDLLIKAFVNVQKVHGKSELWIIGDGPETDNLKNMAINSVAADQIKFLGAVYNPLELGNYLMQAGIYVLAGMGGLSINEAMAYGKPVICSRADGTEKKLVRDGINGYYFRENDENDLAAKIIELIKDPDKIKRFGEYSTRIIKNEININTVIDGYRKAFSFVMKSVTT